MPTLKMIGHADLYKGLYYLRGSAPSHDVSCFDVNIDSSQLHNIHTDIDVWRLRLGHPSTTVLEQVSNTFPYVKINKKTVCDVCHLAKQNQLPYPTCRPFELVHMDIRGPNCIRRCHQTPVSPTIQN